MLRTGGVIKINYTLITLLALWTAAQKGVFLLMLDPDLIGEKVMLPPAAFPQRCPPAAQQRCAGS